MRHLSMALAMAVAASAAGAQTVIYDTFNEDDQADLFDCCNSLTIGGGLVHEKASVSLPFTVPAKGKITEIDIPLFYTSGEPNEMQILVIGEHQKKHKFLSANLGPGGQCCAFVTLTPGGIPVVPGVNYSILVKPRGGVVGGWNLNSAGISGGYEVFAGKDGQEENGTLPAVRIIGR